jgi:MFS family permease
MVKRDGGASSNPSGSKDYLIKEPEFKVEGVGTAYRWYVFSILSLLYLFDYADRLVLSAVQEMIKADWALTDTQVSALSTVVVLTVGVLALPVSFAVDRWSRRKSIAIMAMVWSVATLAVRFTNSFRQLLVFRAVLGVGEAGYSAGSFPLLSAYFSREQRAKIFGFFSAFTAIGAATGVIIGGRVGYTWGWRWAFGAVAVPGLILAILAWFIKDYKTVPLEQESGGLGKVVFGTMGKIIRIPSFIFASLGTMCHDIAFYGLMMWLTSFLIRFRGMEGKQASTVAGVIMLMALIGSPLGGIITDWLYKKTPRGRNYMAAFSNAFMAVMIIVFCLLSDIDSTALFTLVGIVMGISVTLYIAPDASINQDIVHQGYRSVVWGMRIFITMAIGGALGIMMTGVLSDMFESLKVSIMIMSAFGFLGAVFYLIGARFYEADLAKVRVLQLQEERA